MREYTSVTLPRFLLLKIDAVKETYGYTSRADFVKTSIRRELERLSKTKETKHES